MKHFLKLSAVVVFAFGALLVASGTAVPMVLRINAATVTATPSPSPVTGRDLYLTNCAKCHRDDGTGGETMVDGKKIDPEDLTGERVKRRSDAKLYDDIAEGSPDDGMPSFRDKLKDTEINAIVKYIRTELQKGGPH